MDISGIINTSDIRASTMLDARQAAEIDRFREILENAMANLEEQSAAQRAELRRAAEMFESYFLHMMFREMRRTSFDEQGLFPRSNAERIFTDMLDEEIANSATRNGGVGLADMIYRQLTRDFM